MTETQFINAVYMPGTPQIDHYRFAPAGIENPLDIKSVPIFSVVADENKLFKLVLAPSFLRLLRSFSSSRTLAVKDAVAAFLIPPLGVAVPLPGCGVAGFCNSLVAWTSVTVTVGTESTTDRASPCFFRFLPDPGAFFKQCVRPCSFSLLVRVTRRAASVVENGRIEITLSGT